MNVLLVDDEPMIRKMMKLMLEKRGHQVFDAVDGVHAVALHEKHSIDVLVTDVVMQEMGGFSLAKSLLERQPDLPVIFISGYPLDLEAQLQPFCRCGFLRKPFRPGDLVSALSEVVGRPA